MGKIWLVLGCQTRIQAGLIIFDRSGDRNSSFKGLGVRDPEFWDVCLRSWDDGLFLG